MIKRLFREPLLHFLLAGAAIFAVVAALSPAESGGERIAIDRDDLLAFMQGRAQVYDAQTFGAMLDTMPAEDREQLIRDAALQEALYREGLALELVAADPLIRQRVVQQMRMLVIEEAAAGVTVSDEEVSEYFDAHRAEYAQPSEISFEHVFARSGEEQAEALREQLVAGEEDVAGDRFPYQRVYTDVSQEVVASQFGTDFAEAVFYQPVGRWSVPLQSDHGWHIVRLSERLDTREPDFADVEGRVREDALAAKRQVLANSALDDFLARYRIEVARDLNP